MIVCGEGTALACMDDARVNINGCILGGDKVRALLVFDHTKRVGKDVERGACVVMDVWVMLSSMSKDSFCQDKRSVP